MSNRSWLIPSSLQGRKSSLMSGEKQSQLLLHSTCSLTASSILCLTSEPITKPNYIPYSFKLNPPMYLVQESSSALQYSFCDEHCARNVMHTCTISCSTRPPILNSAYLTNLWRRGREMSATHTGEQSSSYPAGRST